MSSESSEFGKPPSGLTKLIDPIPDQEESLLGSRAELRREMDKMRRSLTIGEQAFLESLVVNGNDVEVKVARKRLSDISIFLPHEDEEKVDIEVRDDEGFGDSIAIGRGTCVDIEDESGLLPTITPAQPRHSALRRSSIKVVQALELRRSSQIHGQIWKAHEEGIAVTENGARKLASRRASATDFKAQVNGGNSVLRTEQVTSSIFRETTIEKRQQTLFSAIDAVSPTMPKSIMRPSDIPSPISLAAVRSSGFRKSVSFQKGGPCERSQSFTKGVVPPLSTRDPLRREVSDLSLGSEAGGSHLFSSTSTVDASVPSKEGRANRSDSVTSFPSLHEANTLQSESLASIPSLHRAFPVRSPSVASTTPSAASDPSQRSPVHQKPILLRMASRNRDNGEGIEVTELDDEVDVINKARLYARMLSTGEVSTVSSWDETVERDSIFRDFRRTLSDDENLSSYFLGNTSTYKHATTSIDRPTSRTDIVSAESLLNDSVRSTAASDQPDLEVVDDSWDLDCDTDEHPDAWDVLKDPNAIGYGANGTLPFRIFGTSADDESSKPHVLSPPLLESLQNFLPYGLSDQNFWMKYSLVRDGASMHSLLQHIRGAKYSIIALETSDGEVFGSFTSEVWRKNWNYFGTGESFLWRMRQPRTTECHTVEEQAHLESELDVYPWTGENNCVQLCTHDTIAVGGGTPTSEKKDETDAEDKVQYGFGLAIERLLLHGTSSHCATFGSPPLSKLHPDGSPFEIMNLEVWTLTPSYNLEDAEKLELGKLFLSGQ